MVNSLAMGALHGFSRALGCVVLALLGACASSPPPSSPAAPCLPTEARAPEKSPPTSEVAPQRFADEPLRWVFADAKRRERVVKVLDLVDPILQEEMDRQKLVGVSFGLVVDGELLYAKGYGRRDLGDATPPDADTVYRIGSLTKAFTALGVLKLRDEGTLALDEPLATYLPEAAKLVYPTRDSPPMTLRQVLHHTSGLPRDGGFEQWESGASPTRAQMLGSLDGLALERAPGTGFDYSNLGYQLLGLMIENVSHSHYRDYISRSIFGPLGMKATVWDRKDVPAQRLAAAYKREGGEPVAVPHWQRGDAEASGGIYSSVRDMARYISFQLDAYPPRSDPDDGPVHRSSVRETHANTLPVPGFGVVMHADEDGRRLAVSAPAYGFGWGVFKTCAFDFLLVHGGETEGYGASIALLPDYGIGAVALANVNDAELGPALNAILVQIVERAELSKRTLDPGLSERFAPAMKRLLAVYDQWDEAGYDAMLSKGRKRLAAEKEELASYHALHGACTSYEVIEVQSERAARFAMHCERGELEMDVTLGSDGLITGFSGISRGVPMPERTARVARDVLALIARWDPAVYARSWQSKDSAAAKRAFAGLRRRYGRCKVTGNQRRFESDELTVRCDRGGELTLSFSLSDGHPAKITHYAIRPVRKGNCPQLD